MASKGKLSGLFKGLLFSLVIIALVFPLHVVSVDKSKFRTCSNTAFCQRLRKSDKFQYQDYEVDASSVVVDESAAKMSAKLLNGRFPQQDALDLSLNVLGSGAVRVSVREHQARYPRWEAGKDILQADAMVPFSGLRWSKSESDAKASFGLNEVSITFKPFTVTLLVNGQKSVVINNENLFTFEQYRDKNPKPAVAEGEEAPAPLKFPYDTDGMWEESFGGHTDTKPRGPSAVGVDVSFPGSQHVYGIPEHASDFALKNTDGTNGGYSEPFRLWNLDVFEFDLDVPMALYGAVPFLVSHDEDKTVGALWLNAAETYVDIRS